MKYGIKGIDDQVPVLGYIKIGGRKRLEGKTDPHGRPRVIPVKYDHFVVTSTDQDDLGYIPDDEMTKKLLADQMGILLAEHTEPIYDENGTIIKTIQTITDKQLDEENRRLTRLVVILPFDKLEDNLITSLAVYDNDGCRCRGNNEEAEYINPNTGKVQTVRCPCNLLSTRLSSMDDIEHRQPHESGLKPEPGKGLMCKANGVLYVILKQARTLGGLHVFRTTSINSIRQLRFSMRQISELTGGFLAGIPLVLEMRAKKLSPGPGKKLQTSYVVMLTRKQADPNQFLTQVLNNSALRENLRKRLASKNFDALPAPGRESPYDAFAIREEFYNPDGSVEADICGEFVDADFTEQPTKGEQPPNPETKVKTKAKAKTQESPAGKAQPTLTQRLDEPPALEPPKTSQEPQTAEAPPETPPPPSEAGVTAQGTETPAAGESETATQDPAIITFGRFKPVDTRMPAGADETNASKDSRRAFFSKLKDAGYSDDEIRGWLEALWRVQSSSALKSWQVTSMLDALA